MERRTRHAPAAGFSLVETLVATLIVIVGVTGVLAMFPQAYRSVHTSERIAALSRLGESTLEELRGLDFDDPRLAPGTHPAIARDDDGRFYYPVAGMPQAYSLRWVVEPGPTDASGAAVAGMKRVTVQATYDVRYLRMGIPRRRALTPDSRELVFSTLLTDDR